MNSDDSNLDNQQTTVNSNTQSDIRTSIYDEILQQDILDLLGVGDIPEKDKEEIYKKMLDTILNRVILRLDDQVSNEEAEALKQTMENGDKQAFFRFFEQKGIDINKVFAEEAVVYKVEMLALVNQGGADA